MSPLPYAMAGLEMMYFLNGEFGWKMAHEAKNPPAEMPKRPSWLVSIGYLAATSGISSDTIAFRNRGAPPAHRPGSECKSPQSFVTARPNGSFMSQSGGENSYTRRRV